MVPQGIITLSVKEADRAGIMQPCSTSASGSGMRAAGLRDTLAARVKSPVEGAAGSCGCSARSEEDGDPGDLLRRTTKPTTANVRRPKGYAPLPALGAERTVLRCRGAHSLPNRPWGA